MLAHLLRAGSLSLGRLRLLGYLGHEAAIRVLATECPAVRMPSADEAEEPASRIRQWVLGFADVCDPSERFAIATQSIRALVRAGLHLPTPYQDEAVSEAKPWAAMLEPASICWSTVMQGSSPGQLEARLRHVLQSELVRWLLKAPGTNRESPRPYSVRGTFAVGEFLRHPKFGDGRILSATRGRVEIEFEDGSIRTLGHG